MSPDSETVAESSATEQLSFQRYRLAGAGWERSFDRRLIHIGTAPDNDLVLDDPMASRAHARLEFDGVGYLLRDLGSKNGSWLNGVRVKEAYAPNGAQIRFGRAEISFSLAEERVEVALATGDAFGRLLGGSSQMREIFALLARVAGSEVPVLLEGESGTGKELAAEAIHSHSPLRDREMIIFDCSAVAPELIESELFGHVKGAFTGAVAARTGVFELAEGSTLLLDEVGELPLELQPKLLRALEGGEFRPVGSNARRRAKVRVIAATNRRLSEEVEAGSFRRDLYYRLAVIKVRLPSLRQRPEDVPGLVKAFLQEADPEGLASVGWETMLNLQAHPWPGNVRELRNYVHRAVVLSEGGRLETRHLSNAPLDERDESGSEPGEGERALVPARFDLPFKEAKARLLSHFEGRYWRRLLEASGGNVSEAARRGGIHRKSLEYLLRKLKP